MSKKEKALKKLKALKGGKSKGKTKAKVPGKTKAKATTKTKASGQKSGRPTGVGAYAKDLIRAGKSNEQVLDTVLKKFPEAQTTIASINWYRHDMRRKGEKIKTARELKKAS